MNKFDLPAIIGGLSFALVWFLITRDLLQSISTGIIFAIAWYAGKRLSAGKSKRDRDKRR